MSSVDLRLGDCLEILPTLKDNGVDAVITDPPYPNKSNHMTDMIDISTKAFKLIRSNYGGLILWFWNTITDPPFTEPITARHVWHKTNGWQAGKWEAINVYGDTIKCGHVFSFPNVNIPGTPKRSDLGNHPTPKPVGIMKALILWHTKPGDTILDPFMGVAATGIACVQTGRNFIGIEINKDYFAIAEKRIAEAQLQMRMEI